MKECTKCLVTKAVSEFAKKLKTTSYWCKECFRKYAKQHYRKNKQQHYTRNRLAQQRKYEFLIDKKSAPCTDCKQHYPHYVMEFDHARGVKEHSVSSLTGNSWKKMLSELEKCDVVCSNCHSARTYFRRYDTPT